METHTQNAQNVRALTMEPRNTSQNVTIIMCLGIWCFHVKEFHFFKNFLKGFL
jgi:hypothetical protein